MLLLWCYSEEVCSGRDAAERSTALAVLADTVGLNKGRCSPPFSHHLVIVPSEDLGTSRVRQPLPCPLGWGSSLPAPCCCPPGALLRSFHKPTQRSPSSRAGSSSETWETWLRADTCCAASHGSRRFACARGSCQQWAAVLRLQSVLDPERRLCAAGWNF